MENSKTTKLIQSGVETISVCIAKQGLSSRIEEMKELQSHFGQNGHVTIVLEMLPGNAYVEQEVEIDSRLY